MKERADFFEALKVDMLASKKMKNRLKTYWGTETIDDVVVYKKEFEIYPHPEREAVKKITQIFGMDSNLKGASFKGLRSYYLHFNPKKLKSTNDYTRDFIANKLNNYLGIGEERLVELNFHDRSNPNKFTNYTDQDILDYVEDNYSGILSGVTVEANGDTVTDEVVGRYVLLDTDNEYFEYSVTATSVTPIPVISKIWSRDKGKFLTVFESGISIDLRFKKIANIDENSYIVDRAIGEEDKFIEGKIIDLLESENNGSAEDVIQGPTTITDTIWYKSQLRFELSNSKLFNRNDFADIVGRTIDTGYRKKKTKWYKKIISLVLFIIAVYLSAISAGGSLKAFAAYMAVSTVVLSVVQLALARSGQTGFAEYLGKYIKVASIISIVSGISAMIQQLAKEAVRQSIVESIRNGIRDALTDVTTTVTTDSITGITVTETVREFSVSKFASAAFRLVSEVIKRREANKAKDLESQVREQERIKSQIEEQLREEQDNSLHIGIEDIKWYTSPITQDNVQFEVDYLYEGTTYNIQRPSFYPAHGLNYIDR